MVQIPHTGTQQHIVDIRLDLLRERAVTLDTQFQVGAVVAHEVYNSLWQLIALLLIHPSLHGLDDLRVLERVYMVPSMGIATVRGEEALVQHSLEGHAEVVTL